ncbi:MAG: T9SS type A sorting domain-containing protein [Bacteroidetes bacterium]|nr:T9SS type A sorting domain-containing protein [Bacteroidota bacterium]
MIEDVVLSIPVLKTLSVGIDPSGSAENGFFLSANRPNPFNHQTEIKYSIPEKGYVTLIITDLLGNKIAQLVDAKQLPGTYNITFNGRSLKAGTYLYHLTVNGSSENFKKVRKMVVTK